MLRRLRTSPEHSNVTRVVETLQSRLGTFLTPSSDRKRPCGDILEIMVVAVTSSSSSSFVSSSALLRHFVASSSSHHRSFQVLASRASWRPLFIIAPLTSFLFFCFFVFLFYFKLSLAAQVETKVTWRDLLYLLGKPSYPWHKSVVIHGPFFAHNEAKLKQNNNKKNKQKRKKRERKKCL